MIKKYGLVLAGVAALVLMGAGCSGGKTDQSMTPEKAVEVTDTTDNPKVLESYVFKVFGEAQITTVLNDFPVKGATNINYKASRPAEQKDVAALENMLKKNGFEAHSTLVEGVKAGDYAVTGENKTHIILFTLTIGETKIEALIMPASEDEEYK